MGNQTQQINDKMIYEMLEIPDDVESSHNKQTFKDLSHRLTERTLDFNDDNDDLLESLHQSEIDQQNDLISMGSQHSNKQLSASASSQAKPEAHQPSHKEDTNEESSFSLPSVRSGDQNAGEHGCQTARNQIKHAILSEIQEMSSIASQEEEQIDPQYFEKHVNPSSGERSANGSQRSQASNHSFKMDSDEDCHVMDTANINHCDQHSQNSDEEVINGDAEILTTVVSDNQQPTFGSQTPQRFMVQQTNYLQTCLDEISERNTESDFSQSQSPES
jgi:hypothetical protein